ncbi:hypothetical protein A0257_07855 [Hymenobacter psoromatis]|nr:hypothetical protein A0257_07855 [Hymenobacter psoromatis]
MKKTEDIPAEVLQAATRQASLRAMSESRALGLTVTVYENGQLVRIHPNGQREVVTDQYQNPGRKAN